MSLLSMRTRLAALLGAVALAGLAAGCGGGSSEPEPVVGSTPAAATPTPVQVGQGATPGGQVRAGAATPKRVARALSGTRVVVVAFLVSGAADDDLVGAAIGQLRRSPTGRRGVQYFVYNLDRKPNFGDLPEILGVTETPSVVVVGRDRALTNRWVGLVDSEILRQSVADAKSSPPRPREAPAPVG